MLDVMAMPLPPFHVHMHTASCQAQNALNRVDGGGLGMGEPTEQMNRYLGIAGVVLQYAALANRALWLEVLFRRWNLRKQAGLPRLLVHAGYRAIARRQQQTQEKTERLKQAVQAVKSLRAQGKVDAARVARLKEEVCIASVVHIAALLSAHPRTIRCWPADTHTYNCCPVWCCRLGLGLRCLASTASSVQQWLFRPWQRQLL